MNLEGAICRLRAMEPNDIDNLYTWENNMSVWSVSGTTAPFSRHTLSRFIDEQQFDIFQTKQQRLIIDSMDGDAVGAIDIFEFDPLNRRAGIGILIHDLSLRGKGYATDAINIVCNYAKQHLGVHQLWCNVGVENSASIALFEKCGFEKVGIKRDWIQTPQGYEDEQLMQKIL